MYRHNVDGHVEYVGREQRVSHENIYVAAYIHINIYKVSGTYSNTQIVE